MLDTGYYLHHQALKHLIDSSRIVATYDFINSDEDVEDLSVADQQRSHGTYTLSALAGYMPGTLIGPAYNSEYILAKTERVDVEIQAEEDYWVAGIEWAESSGVDIVSSSLGYTDWYTWQGLDTALCTRAANISVSKGVVVVNAAGNERDKSWHYIIAPANGDSVIAVGAVDLEGNISLLSSAGFQSDFQNGKIKPDVCACGVGTYCANMYGSYSYVDGTSLSTPLVAGACALILQADTSLNPIGLRERLWSTAYGVNSPDTLYGYGIVNAVKAAGFDTTSIQTQENILAFPNPFGDYLYIYVKTPQSSKVKFSVFNIAGEKVLQSSPTLYDSEKIFRGNLGWKKPEGE
jgi:subtilisin family serine protease